MRNSIPDTVDLTSLTPIRLKADSLGEYLQSLGTEPEISINSIFSLNQKMWGLQKKRMTIIGARTGHCKSSLALQIAYDISKKHRTLYLTLEMTEEVTLMRLFCNVMKVSNEDLMKGGFSKYLQDFQEFKKKIDSSRLVISEKFGSTWKHIESIVSEINPKPEIIIIDYVQSIKNARNLSELDDYIKNMRNLAIEHDFCLILVSQINRESVKLEKEPTLEGLKSSGFLEEHADKVILLYWEYNHNENADKNRIKVTIAKNKDGRTGYLQLRYEPEYYLFSDWSEMDAKRNEDIP